MSIFKAKYKMHKFVNYIFYVIVFFIGFLVGLGIKKLDLKNVLSNVFFLDNVEAFTIAGTNYDVSYDFIIESFERNSEFSLEDYPNIICGLWHYDAGYDSLACNALSADLTNYTFTSNNSSSYKSVSISGSKYFFNYRFDTSSYITEPYLRITDSNIRIINNTTGYYIAHSNFSIPDVTNNEQPYYDLYPKLIDFSVITLTNDSDYLVTSSNYNDEEFLVNYFNHYVNDVSDLNLSINNFSNVYTFYDSASSYHISYCNEKTSVYKFYLGSSPSFDLPSLFNCVSFFHSSNSDFKMSSGGSRSLNTSSYIFSSTEDYSEIFGNKFKKVLDFSSYLTPDLVFDENLFENDPNFKKVCVNNYSSYAITRTSNPSNLDYMTDYDYIWFPYYIYPEDISMINYQNAAAFDSPDISSLYPYGTFNDPANVFHFSYLPYNFYNSLEVINSVFDSNDEGLNLRYKGYINKYSYYGWSSLLFNLWFDYRDDNDFNFFPIITFNINHSTVHLSSSHTLHGGSGRRLGLDEDLENEVETSRLYCFYIKNEYLVTEIKTNEFNDFYGDVPTQNGNFDFFTSEHVDSSNPTDLFSIVTSFMSKISGTINFINSLVYDFFLSMPLIVRLFVVSVLTLFFIKFIIDMIVR